MTTKTEDQLMLLLWARDAYRDGLGDAVDAHIEYLRKCRTAEQVNAAVCDSCKMATHHHSGAPTWCITDNRIHA